MSESKRSALQPDTLLLEQVNDREHLEWSTVSTLRCSVCGKQITIDPNSGVEYGHKRGRKSVGNRCKHRPSSVDP